MIWASQSLADLVRRPSLARANVVSNAELARAGAMFDDSVEEHDAFDDTLRFEWIGGGVRRTTIAASPLPHVGAATPAMETASIATHHYTLSAPQPYPDPAAGHAGAIAVGDVTGDGRDDLVWLSLRSAPNMNDSAMEIWAAYQTDDGRLGPAVKLGESGTNLAYQLLVVDFDNDGIGDVITATVDGIMVLRSNGDGTYTKSSRTISTPTDVYDILATDVDRDGYLDLLVDTSNTMFTVLHGNATGVIDRISSLTMPTAATRALGDVNGDGLDDLLLGCIFNRPLEEWRVYPALATGGYGPPVVYSLPTGSNMPASLAVGDFNGDGRNDVALDEGKDYADLHLYYQDASGKLGPKVDIPRARGATTSSLIATDLDRDGRTDLAFAHSGWYYVGVFLQERSGLTPETVYGSSYMGIHYFFMTGDMNHDGCGDLVISRDMSQSPVIQYGQGCVPPPVAVCTDPGIPVPGFGMEPAASLTSPVPRTANEADPLRRNR